MSVKACTQVPKQCPTFNFYWALVTKLKNKCLYLFVPKYPIKYIKRYKGNIGIYAIASTGVKQLFGVYRKLGTLGIGYKQKN
jgi:hypothetical protein